MSEQAIQLDIMATGGFDIQTTNNQLQGEMTNLNPEALLLMKEKVQQDMLNPCINCVHEHATDCQILDYCHYHCKATVEVIDLV